MQHVAVLLVLDLTAVVNISAFCYALEYSRIKELRQSESCTSRLQEWNQPRKRHLESREVDDITFVKEEYGKEKRRTLSMVYDPRPTEFKSTSVAEISTLRDGLSSTGKAVSLLHLPLPDSTIPTAGLFLCVFCDS